MGSPYLDSGILVAATHAHLALAECRPTRRPADMGSVNPIASGEKLRYKKLRSN